MDGQPPAEEDFTVISVADRLTHKNWKARVSGYDALIKSFNATTSDSDPAFRPYLANTDILKKIIADANVVAQEKGVEVLVAFVKFAGENAARTRDDILPTLVDKCLGSTRAGTKANAIELILQYVEVENSGDGVVRDILPGLNAKQPKAVAGCVSALKETVRVFGSQVVAPAPLLKALPKIFGHTDKTVRSEGTALAQALYQCIGAAIQPSLVDLKPVQVKELTEAFEAMESSGHGKGTLVPERYTIEQARQRESAVLDGLEEPQEPEEIDPRSFADEVDVLPLMPPGFIASLASSKWKERKEALDDFLVVLQKTLRIKDRPELADVVKALAGKMTDVNIPCLIAAANCLEALAKGIGKPFSKYREVAVSPMLERLKERKQTVTDAIGAGLDAIFATTSLQDIVGDIVPPLSNKSPQVKEGALKFLHRCLTTATAPPLPPQIKQLSETVAGMLDDSAEPIRNEAALTLGCLMKIAGERAMNAVMEPLDDLRKGKVRDAFEKAVVKCKIGAPAAPKPAPSPKDAPPKKKAPLAKKASPVADPDEQPTSASTHKSAKPVAKPPAKKPPAAAAPLAAPAVVKKPPAAAGAKAAAPSLPPASSLETVKYKHMPEDAETLALDFMPTAIVAGLADANWKARLAALEEMLTWLGGDGGGRGTVQDVDSEVVVRFLAKRGWGEKNFQVSAKIYAVLALLAEQCPSFARPSAALAIGHLSEKLGDIKLKKPAGDTLTAFAEKTSLAFVLNQAYEPLSKQKAPKVVADSISWINQALIDFGIVGLSLKALVEYLKEGLKNSNAAVRASATTTMVTLKLFAGAGIMDLLQDLNPQLLATVQNEFTKVDGTAAPTPTRQGLEASPVSSKGSGSTAQPLDDLFPRVDLDRLVAGTAIIADAKSEAWKTRKEALEMLQGILDVGANKRLKPNMGDIGQVLKSRVSDTNKAAQLLALDIIARVATGMNKPFEKHARLFVTPVAMVVADQKANIRAAGLQTLTAIALACEGLDSMVTSLATALETANPQLRGGLLGWMADWLKEHDGGVLPDVAAWAAPLVLCLEDKSGDVRKGAQAVLPWVIAQIGVEKVIDQAASLKPASRSAVIPLIQAVRPAASTASAALAARSRAATAVPTKAASPPPEPAPSPEPSAPLAKITLSRATGVRSKNVGGVVRPESRTELEAPPAVRRVGAASLKKPGGTSSSSTTPTPSTAHPVAYFTGANPDVKRTRLARDIGKWIVEGPPVRKDLGDALHHQMEPHISSEIVALLFSNGHEAVQDHITGVGMMSDCFTQAIAGDSLDESMLDQMRMTLIANADLPLKYISIRVHEPPPNLVAKCLDLLDNVLNFFRSQDYQLLDAEAQCFIPTIIHKLGDAREPVRVRVQQLVQSFSRVYAYSRLFQLLLEHGLRSKVAKTRQGALDELSGILKRSGLGACEPAKAFPQIAALISDKDVQVRKSALGALCEAYNLVGDKIWMLVGPLNGKDKTQLEERLKRVAEPATPTKSDSPPAPNGVTRLATGLPRPQSPGLGGRLGLARPASPAVGSSKLARASSPSRVASSHIARAASPGPSSLRPPSVAGLAARPKLQVPSRLGAPRSRPQPSAPVAEPAPHPHPNGRGNGALDEEPEEATALPDDITVTISSILSNDPTRSVEALKKVQRILDVSPEQSASSPQFKDLSEHTEGLIETITLQMNHIFERQDQLAEAGTFRVAKHLIQTLNAFCDHTALAESLSVEILTALLEELTMRLMHTDDSREQKVKDLSRFINMLILRMFALGRRIYVFRALFALLLQIVKPFPMNGTLPDSQEARVAELVLKCVWKLARNIPGDLAKNALDTTELFPAIEHFLQSIPPNEWRARATNRVPSGDMPLRTIKVIIQHVVAHYGDDVYEQLSSAFEDPSATIVYPYVYRILNSNSARATAAPTGRARSGTHGSMSEAASRPTTYAPSSPKRSSIASSTRDASPERTPPRNHSPVDEHPMSAVEPDPDAQLIQIIGHISSETTGALHKEGITELHQFMKKYPHKRAKVDKVLEATGPAFRKYIARALASRAAEDQERDTVVADTLSRLESVRRESVPEPPVPSSPRRSSVASDALPGADRLSRLHDVFQYRPRGQRASMISTGQGTAAGGDVALLP